MSSEQKTNELTRFEFPEPDSEVLDEIIEVSKFIILLFSLSAIFYAFNVSVPATVPLVTTTLLSIS